jgi:hypothetical protein
MQYNTKGRDESIRDLERILLEMKSTKAIDLLPSEMRTKFDGKNKKGKARNKRKVYEDAEFWKSTESKTTFAENVYEKGYKGIYRKHIYVYIYIYIYIIF